MISINYFLYFLSCITLVLFIISCIFIINKMNKIRKNKEIDTLREKVRRLEELEKMVDDFPQEERPESEYIKVKMTLISMIGYYKEMIKKLEENN